MTSFDFPAIGTQWQIDIYDNFSSKKELEIKNKAVGRIEEFDKTYSRFRKDSWVTKFSRKAQTLRLPSDFIPLVSVYKEAYELSGGLVTPLIGRTLVDAGYDPLYSLKPKEKISKPESLEILSWTEDSITSKKPVLLDFGAAGKGYIIDIISDLLIKNGVHSFCIDAGGDILHRGNESLRVGLEHPDDPTLAIGIANISNNSICASAGNRRKWEGFHHTINPFTLKSPDEVKAVWVIAKDATTADMLTTCLYLDPHPMHYKDFKFEYVILYKDNKAQKSPGFSGEIFN